MLWLEPDPFYPIVQPNSGLTFPWSFMTRDAHDANWGGAGQRVVERMIVNWNDYYDITAQSQLCGYGYIDDNALLQRVPPWQHPIFTWLYVDEENGISGVKPAGEPYKSVGPNGPYVQYPYAILTLVFTERKYYLGIGDYSGLKGPPPYLELVDKGTAEYLALSGGTYKYDPNDPTVQAANLGGATPFKQGLAILDTKDTLTARWHLVPHFWLHNKLGIASNLLACLGTINTEQFLGFAPGLLYLDSHDKERKSFAVNPNSGVFTTPGQIQNTWAWDLTMYFKYRNPPTDNRDAVPVKFGWNLCPAPQAGAGNYWYPVVSNPLTGFPNSGGSPLYLGSDFNNIFLQAQ